MKRVLAAVLGMQILIAGTVFGGEKENQVVDTYTANALAQYIFSAYLRGECGKYAPKEVRTSLEGVQGYIAELESKVTPSFRQQLVSQIEDAEVQAEMLSQRKRNIDDVLFRNASIGVDPAFSCGMVLTGILPALKEAERERKRLIDVFDR